MSAIDVIATKAQTGQKFVDDEVTPELSRTAGTFLREYIGTFTFLADVKADALARGGWRSRAQVRGVLNCMVAEVRHGMAAQAVATPAPSKPLAIRDGLYTVVLPEGHRTLRIRHGQGDSADVQFVAFLSGANNDNDYTCCGFIKNGQYRWSKRFAGNATTDSALAMAVATVVFGTDEQQTAAGRAYALVSGSCYICNRTLTDPTSIATGVGPICRENNGIEAIQPEPPEGAPLVAPVTTADVEAETERQFVATARQRVGRFGKQALAQRPTRKPAESYAAFVEMLNSDPPVQFVLRDGRTV